MLKNLQSILDILKEKLFNNIIVGQTIKIFNQNYDAQINRISKNNVRSICVSNSESKLIQKNYKRIRRVQYMYDCLSDNVLSIDSDLLQNIMKNETSSFVGFQSQLNKNKNLPIDVSKERQIFSETSLDFILGIGDSNYKFRKLNTNDLNINFEIRLKIPSNKKNENNYSTDVGDSTCVQYQKTDKKVFEIICETWYDEDESEVVCVCNKQGLTINIIDKVLSKFSKLKQFPSLGIELCINYYY